MQERFRPLLLLRAFSILAAPRVAAWQPIAVSPTTADAAFSNLARFNPSRGIAWTILSSVSAFCLPRSPHHACSPSLDVDLAKFDQSRLHISMFCSLKFQRKRRMQQATLSDTLSIAAAHMTL
jgi:hypothetical protein